MPANTTINGNTFSFVQIETQIGALPIASIKDISYTDDLHRSLVYGTASAPLGATRGVLGQEGSIEFYRAAFFTAITGQFGVGWRQQQLTITVSYGPNDNGLVVVDTLPAVLIGKVDSSNGQSDDGPALTMKVNLFLPVPILWNGVPSIVETFPTIAVA
jgi:hypothetical protein